MIIQHFKYPFNHTIIYDYFDEEELSNIHKEVKKYCVEQIFNKNDKHHTELLQNNKTLSFSLDEMHMNNRNNSFILQAIKKIYEMAKNGTLYSKDNPFLKYIPSSNQDNTFLQLYKNDSSYYEHGDGSVLTFLYPFVLNATGGDLVFTEYEYKPYLTNNCCFIFPSYERHKLTKVKSNSKSFARFSINQRIYIQA